MKKRIRLTESDLHRIVNRSVKRVLREESQKDSILFNVGRALSQYYNSNIVNYDANDSNENVIAITVQCNPNEIQQYRSGIDRIMQNFGFSYYNYKQYHNTVFYLYYQRQGNMMQQGQY